MQKYWLKSGIHIWVSKEQLVLAKSAHTVIKFPLPRTPAPVLCLCLCLSNTHMYILVPA